MPSYGVFEDDHLITGVFTDLGSAEDFREKLQGDPGMIYGVLEALELCPEHEDHAYGACTAEADDEIDMLQRVRDGLEKL